MNKTFVNQGLEYAVYSWKPEAPAVSPTLPPSGISKALTPDPWQLVFSISSPFPAKTGLGLKEIQESFVVLSTELGS